MTGSRKAAAGYGLLSLATFLAYFPSWRGDWLWNDSDYVTTPALRGVSGLLRIWFHVGATQQYYPILHSAFWVEHRLWGDHPLGYHLLNIGLHAACACLFIRILQLIGGPARTNWAWFGGVLFALHPVMVESVAWISEQKNTLSTVLYLAAAAAYLREPRRYFVATACFACAVLAKSVAATLPAALLVATWYREEPWDWRRHARLLAPWFAIGAAAGLFTAWVERRYVGAEGGPFQLTWGERILVAGRAFWFYLGKEIWPANLVFNYSRWHLDPASIHQWLFPLLAAGALTAAFVCRRRSRALFAALIVYTIALFPVLGFLNVYAFIFSFVADHLQYLATLAPIALAAGAWGLWRERAPVAALATAALVALACAILTWRQSGRYVAPEPFYEAILARNPHAWMARNNLGLEFDAEGRRTEAMTEYRLALQDAPQNPDAACNLGADLDATGRSEEAVPLLEAALRLRPGFREARINLAIAHDHIGVARLKGQEPAAAIAQFEESLQLDPGLTPARLNLGVAFASEDRWDDAVRCYREVLLQSPDDAQAHENLGLVWAKLGQWDAAIAEFRKAARLRPSDPEARRNLATAIALKESSLP